MPSTRGDELQYAAMTDIADARMADASDRAFFTSSQALTASRAENATPRGSPAIFRSSTLSYIQPLERPTRPTLLCGDHSSGEPGCIALLSPQRPAQRVRWSFPEAIVPSLTRTLPSAVWDDQMRILSLS